MLYNVLLGLGIIIDVNILKYDSQCSNLIYVLVILMNLLRQSLSLTIPLRYLQDILSGSGVESLCQDRRRWTLFIFIFSLFLFLEQLRLEVISHAVTSVTT